MPLGKTKDGRVIVHRDIWARMTFVKQVVKVDGKRVTRTIFFPQIHPGHYDAVRQHLGHDKIFVQYGDANRMLGYRLKHDKD